MKKKHTITFLLSLLTLIGTVHAKTPNFIIQNNTYGPNGENEYANIKVIIGNWVGGNIKVPEKSTQTATLPPNDAPPVYLDVDVYFKNLPLANKQNCGRKVDKNKTLKLYINTDRNPIDSGSLIKCEWIES